MSLTGKLEDLPLLDILQIVSFSKKTGYLSIQAPTGLGAIVFVDGFIVCCFSPETGPLDPQVAGMAAPQKAQHLRRRIEIALEQLVRLHEGQFSFSLTDQPPTSVGNRSIAGETIEGGLNAQELLLDLARGMDEDRRNSSAAIEVSFAEPEEVEEEASFAEGVIETEPVAPEPPSPPPVPAPDATQAVQAIPAAQPIETRTVLLVDDEDDVRETLAHSFREHDYEVHAAADPDEALKVAQRLRSEGMAFMVVTDLGMPTSGGSSFQGGFEIVKRLTKANMRPATLLMTESPSPAIRARARQMGIDSLVFKPGLSKLDPEQFAADMAAFAERIVMDLLPRLTRREPPGPRTPRHRGPVPAGGPGEDLSRQFTVLQKHLEELRQPSNANQITMLVMRAAREFVERALLFLIKNEEIRGLGGFGRAPRDQKLSMLAREIVIPLREPSVFREVVMRGKSYAGAMPDGRWEQNLLVKIGRFKSGDIFLIPLRTHRECVAVLFGDNPETGGEVGRLDALELFVSQAGLAFENVFLQRKIEALQRG